MFCNRFLKQEKEAAAAGNLVQFLEDEVKTIWEFAKLQEKAKVLGKRKMKNGSPSCRVCNGQVVNDDDWQMICTECGVCEETPNNREDNLPFDDRIAMPSQFVYKREAHFAEWLAKSNGQEQGFVPKTVKERVFAELTKRRVKKGDAHHGQVRDLLKRTGNSKYYDNTQQITKMYNGDNCLLVMTSEQQEVLKSLFAKIQQPFEVAIVGTTRKNFLSYSFVLRKFCELLEYDSFLERFKLLKSRQKLAEQDRIWRHICTELKWQFIPSV